MKCCPRTALWVDFRIQSPKCADFCSFLFWILQLLVYICIPIRVGGPRNSKTISVKTIMDIVPHSQQTNLSASYRQLYYLPLMLYVWAAWAGLVGTWSLPYTGTSNRLSPRFSHEARAAGTILILVSIFLFFIVSLPFWLFVIHWLWIQSSGWWTPLC